MQFTAKKKGEFLDSFPKPSPPNELLWALSNEAQIMFREASVSVMS